MMHNHHHPQIPDYFLEPGFILITQQPTCISTVLGTCVSVCLYDRRRQCGGMNHFRFPLTEDRTRSTALYGNVATLSLVRMMLEQGSREKHLEAQIFGGAYNPDVSTTDIGRENVRMAQKALHKYQIRIVSEDVGGMMGRKVVFNTGTAELA
jgi:chemotaxis protein CheD